MQQVEQQAGEFQLSNVQQELLKLYSTDLDETELYELKMQLASFYARKAVQGADKVWEEKAYMAEDMDSWLHE